MFVSRALSAYVSSRLYPKASSSALAYYKWLQGTAVGVGESSSIDRLTSFRVDEVVQRGYSGLVVNLVTPGGLLPAGSRDHSLA